MRTFHPACRNEKPTIETTRQILRMATSGSLHPRASSQHYGFLLYEPRHEKAEKHCPRGNLLGSGRVSVAVSCKSFLLHLPPHPLALSPPDSPQGSFLTCSSTAWLACLPKAMWNGFPLTAFTPHSPHPHTVPISEQPCPSLLVLDKGPLLDFYLILFLPSAS